MRPIFLAALMLAVPGLAAPPRISQVLSKRQAKLGEPIELDVTVAHDRGETYELVLPENLGAFSVLERSTETAHEGDGDVTHLKLQLGVYGTGKNMLPPLAVKEAATGTVTSLPQDAEIETVATLAPGDPQTLRDVAPPRQPFAFDPLKIGAAIAAALALVGLVGFAVRALLRLRKPESEEARDRRLLAMLKGAADGPFFEAVDGILRRSLARSYGVPAIERTSEEIVGAVTARPPAGLSPEQIANVLRESVWVRFAHRPSTEAQKLSALDVCQRLLFPPEAAGGQPDARAPLQ